MTKPPNEAEIAELEAELRNEDRYELWGNSTVEALLATIRAQQERNKALEGFVALFRCIDFERFTKHDKLLLGELHARAALYKTDGEQE